MSHTVVIARAARADYGNLPQAEPAPELPSGSVTTVGGGAGRELLRQWGLDASRFGSAHWNPLGAVIPAGARVVVKPNWVHHLNKSNEGLDCLLTHTSVLECVLQYVALTRPRSVVIGDAPIQGCDFGRLRASCGLDAMVERVASETGLRVDIADFRRTLLPEDRVGGARVENVRPQANYTLVDLGRESLLEPLARAAEKFRVTMYNPDLLSRTHSPGRHQYLIAREVLEADVVISLPKLKAHKKAGVTGALKNLVGINGNKEFLPHHRKGGSTTGGDCYPGGSWLKHRAEDLLDEVNRAPEGRAPGLKVWLAGAAVRGAVMLGEDDNIDGSWYGNDTVWRMCLDLQRILRYAGADGALHAEPQRRVITITDAIVAGEREGPLAPSPIPAGFVTGAFNPAAAEWVHARLMGFDPLKIPLVHHAFDGFAFPLVDFAPDAVRARIDGKELAAGAIRPILPFAFQPARGWKGHIELDR